MLAAQSILVQGNNCYDQRAYACALEKYDEAFKNNMVKPEEVYLVTFRIGFCHRMLGNDMSAQLFLHQSRSLQPDYLYSWYNLGLLYYDTKKNDSAVHYFVKTLPLAENTSEYNNISSYLALTYKRQFKFKEAAEAFKKINTREKKFFDTDLDIGENFAARSLWDSAMVYYAIAGQYIKPTDTTAFGRMYSNMALAYRAKNQHDKALEALQDGLKKSPNHKKLVWEMGITYASAKRYTEAIAQYQKTLNYFVGDTANTYTLLNNIHFCYLYQKDYAKAASYLSQAIQYASKGNLRSDMSRLMAYQAGHLANMEQANLTAQRSIEILQLEKDTTFSLNRENRSKAWAVRAMYALQKKDTTQALQHLAIAKALNSFSLESAVLLGDIYWNRNEKNKAGEFYKQGSAFTGRDTLLVPNKAYARQQGRSASWFYAKDQNANKSTIEKYVNEALRYDSMQMEAIEAWPVALTISSFNFNKHYTACQLLHDKAIVAYASNKYYIARLWNNKGVMYNIKNDTAKVVPAFEKAVAADIDYMQAWSNLFQILTKYKQHSKGLAHANRLIEYYKSKKKHKEHADALIVKGDFLWRMDKKKEARVAYTEAQVIDPSNTNAKNRLLMQ